MDESWATEGIPTSFYSRHKVAVERLLDRLEREAPGLRVARLRPALIFKRRRRHGDPPSVRRAAAARCAAPPRFDPFRARPPAPAVSGRTFPGRGRRLPARAALRGPGSLQRGRRAADRPARAGRDPPGPGRPRADRRAASGRRSHLQAAPSAHRARLAGHGPGCSPDRQSRARAELGCSPQHSATDTFRELLDGLRHGSDDETPPLARGTSGPLRIRELLTGVGARQGL